jgi:hypothetical protein
MALATRTVVGTVKLADGTTAASGTVTFTPNTPLAATLDAQLIPARPISVALSATGAFTTSLVCTDAAGVSPSGWAYTMVVRALGDAARVYTVLIPAGAGSLDMATVTPMASAPALVLYVLAASVGQVGGPAGPLDGAGKVPSAQIPAGGGGSGVPATAVTSATAYGIAPVVGTGTNYARQDHTHGSPSLGVSGTTAAAGNDSRLSDARTPTVHATTHGSGGSDPVTPAAIGADAAGAATSATSAHVSAADPHGDRAYAVQRANHSGTQLAATISDFNTAVATTAALKASNLSDLANAGTARTNLGLGGAATLAVGTTTGTVAAGDDPRLVAAVTWAATTTYARGQLITWLGFVYQATAAFTSGATFALTNLRMLSAPLIGTVVPVGMYAYAGASANVGSANTLSNNTGRAFPIYIPHDVTLTRIGAEVVTIGQAGSKYRLAIYADTGGFLPGTLVLDAGQIAGDVAGFAELTISQFLSAGVYWLEGTVQLGATTQPTMRTFVPAAPSPVFTSAPSGGAGGFFESTVISGAPPATFTVNGTTGTVPRIHLKA